MSWSFDKFQVWFILYSIKPVIILFYVTLENSKGLNFILDHFCTWHFGKRQLGRGILSSWTLQNLYFLGMANVPTQGPFVSIYVSPKGQFNVDIPEWGHSSSGTFWHEDIMKLFMCSQGNILTLAQFFCIGLSSICFLSRLDSCLQTYVWKKIQTARFMLCLS